MYVAREQFTSESDFVGDIDLIIINKLKFQKQGSERYYISSYQLRARNSPRHKNIWGFGGAWTHQQGLQLVSIATVRGIQPVGSRGGGGM